MREGENVLRGMMVAGWTIKEDIIKNGFGIFKDLKSNEVWKT